MSYINYLIGNRVVVKDKNQEITDRIFSDYQDLIDNISNNDNDLYKTEDDYLKNNDMENVYETVVYSPEGEAIQNFRTIALTLNEDPSFVKTNITDDIKELLSYTDLVLLDIKHINDEKCKDLVGFSNKKELAFARYLSDNNIPIWIRQVIIHGITDDEEDLLALKEFISNLSNVKKVELIPYHELGKFKWENLGFNYELEGVPAATSKDIGRAKKILGL